MRRHIGLQESCLCPTSPRAEMLQQPRQCMYSTEMAGHCCKRRGSCQPTECCCCTAGRPIQCRCREACSGTFVAGANGHHLAAVLRQAAPGCAACADRFVWRPCMQRASRPKQAHNGHLPAATLHAYADVLCPLCWPTQDCVTAQGIGLSGVRCQRPATGCAMRCESSTGSGLINQLVFAFRPCGDQMAARPGLGQLRPSSWQAVTVADCHARAVIEGLICISAAAACAGLLVLCNVM